MRWEELFADLEGQLEAAYDAELSAEVSDRTRREVARLRLVDRLRPAVGRRITVGLPGAGPVAGTVRSTGADWLLLLEPPVREVLVPVGAVLWVTGLTGQSAEPGSEGPVAGRLLLGTALRAVGQSRAPVRVQLTDGAVVRGTIDRVGSDFVEVTEVPVGEHRRAGTAAPRTISQAAIALVRVD